MTPIETFKILEGTGKTINLAEQSTLAADAIFTVDEDAAYFVLKDGEKFVTVVGEFHVEDDEPFAYAVNFLIEHSYRDAAIACAIYHAVNDSGRDESIHDRVHATSLYLKPY